MNTVDYDDDTTFLGEWGSFQKMIMALLCISITPNGFTAMSIVFLGDTPPHHCAIPANVNITAEWRNYSIPLEEDNGMLRYSKCTRYKLDVIKLLSDNRSVPGVDVNVTEIEQEGCNDGWEYDREIYVSTIVSEWDLVCSDAWKAPLTTSLMYAGVLCGSFISGQLSDRFGRKIILFGTIAVQTLFTFFQIFSTSWLMFSALFFVVGMGHVSNYVAAFVLGAEILSPRIRIIYSTVGVCICFAFGYMLLPLMAFFIRDWRMLLIAMGVPGIFYFPLWRFIPESPRWLLSQGRVEEAEDILRGAAKQNRVKAPEVIFQPLQVVKVKKVNHHNIYDLLKSNNIRQITILLSFVWLVISIGYFALALNTSNLSGDPFLNCFFSAAVEVPAYILSWVLFRSYPRRLCLSPMLVLGGAVLLLTQFIPGVLLSLYRCEFSIYCIGNGRKIWGHRGVHYRICLHGGTVPHSPEEHSSVCLLHSFSAGQYCCTLLCLSGFVSLNTCSPLSVSVSLKMSIPLSPVALSPFLPFLFFSCQTCWPSPVESLIFPH
ncbi:organic cation/carnitine transporter 2-like isoform X2 [Conger conger]|uniref:organic cation/carnitine transporter 2-like isoform X2 n=1 Tax=Conger conger TaxID=82655 RepID=UPI002A5AF82F|nr:organic cation/carnitine transporter 2-like isoform X2 [Conger conger]